MSALYPKVNVQAAPILRLSDGRELVLLSQYIALAEGERRKMTWSSKVEGELCRWQITAPAGVLAVSIKLGSRECLPEPAPSWQLNNAHHITHYRVNLDSLIVIMFERNDHDSTGHH